MAFINPDLRSARRTEWIWTVVILVIAAWFYGWTATSAGSPLTFKLQSDDLYNRLADGFLAGHLGFAEKAPPELAHLADPYDPAQYGPYTHFHDVSYYRGRYYIYFGPAPLLILVPWKAITGTYLSQNLATAVFAWWTAVASCLLLRALRESHFPDARSWVVLCGTLAVTFGNVLPILLRRPVVYELCIASACFFGVTALFLLHRALTAPSRQNTWLAWASLSLGLALAARPNYLLGAAGALGIFLRRRWLREKASGSTTWRRLLPAVWAAGIPIGTIGLLLLAYNYARFDSWSQFGNKYQMAGGNQLNFVFTSPRFLPINLYYYFFAPPQFSAFFPFFQVTGFPPFHPPAGFSGEENMYGVLLTLPILFGLRWLQIHLRNHRGGTEESLFSFSAVAMGFVGMNALFILMMAGANNRYLVDFVTPAIPLAWTGILAWESRRCDWRKLLARCGWILALVYTLLFNFFVSLQHNDLLHYHNPTAYRRLAHAFNHLSVWLGETAPDKVGPLHVRLTLPTDRVGKLEPLVVTGLSFRADFLWIFYVDESHIKIGFEHTSYGGPVTDPIEVDFAAEHTLDVAMGSLYPPIEHPFYDGMPSGEIARLKHTLRVTLDGHEVLAGTYDFYDSSPGDVTIGHNPVSDAFGRRFNGRIVSVGRTTPPGKP